ncbi:MAG: energy-coupling factor ABC transporter ATP-binding protein [Treponema sp.]|nr:energy-coupling factor ABC transporter ATP-binding protein [Treponema sp.]
MADCSVTGLCDARQVLFSVRNLSKEFPNGHKAAAGIDLDIFEGECLLVAGSNGSGKTVFMRMLAGLMEPSGGAIFYKGIDILQSGCVQKPFIGLVFQDADAQLLGETVEEDIRFGPGNLKLGRNEIEKQTNAAMEKFGLTDKRDFPPRRLSGGEKRRLAVAGILAMGCDTLILDEPFANLDWPGVLQVLALIKELKNQNKTVIILTHELEKVLALADRLVILDHGTVHACGIPDEVLDRLDAAWGIRDPRHSYKNASDCSWL